MELDTHTHVTRQQLLSFFVKILARQCSTVGRRTLCLSKQQFLQYDICRIGRFLPLDALHADVLGYCTATLFCLFVCQNSCIVSKRLSTSSNFFHCHFIIIITDRRRNKEPTCSYWFYSRADFSVFLRTGVTCCTDQGEISQRVYFLSNFTLIGSPKTLKIGILLILFSSINDKIINNLRRWGVFSQIFDDH